MKPHPLAIKREALSLLTDGLTHQQIANRFNMGRTTITSWAKKLPEDALLGVERPKAGRRRLTPLPLPWPLHLQRPSNTFLLRYRAMTDNIQHLKDDQPRYFGVTTQLNKEMLYGKTSPDEESSDQAADDYFFDTPIRKWSVRDFLKNHSDATPFIAGRDKIRRRRSVDKAIRTYATSWLKYMEGDLGKLRLEAFAAETKTSVTSGIIVGRNVTWHNSVSAAIYAGRLYVNCFFLLMLLISLLLYLIVLILRGC